MRQKWCSLDCRPELYLFFTKTLPEFGLETVKRVMRDAWLPEATGDDRGALFKTGADDVRRICFP